MEAPAGTTADPLGEEGWSLAAAWRLRCSPSSPNPLPDSRRPRHSPRRYVRFIHARGGLGGPGGVPGVARAGGCDAGAAPVWRIPDDEQIVAAGRSAVAVSAFQAHPVKCPARAGVASMLGSCRRGGMHGKCAEAGRRCSRRVVRGCFAWRRRPPCGLDDVLARCLSAGYGRTARPIDPLFPGPVRREARAAVCTRSRYAEDRLAAGAFTQYVVLGVGGLAPFAWRRPNLLGSLTVFEVDHPASQAWKLERVRELGLPLSDSQVFVPVDFEAEPVQDALGPAGFDWARPAMFCWTGVAPDLTAQAIESTLRTIAAAAPGSEAVSPPGRGLCARRRGNGIRPYLHADRGFCRRASSARLAGIRDREANQPVRANGRGPSLTGRPPAAVLRRPHRWAAALYLRDPGGRAGRLSERRPRPVTSPSSRARR